MEELKPNDIDPMNFTRQIIRDRILEEYKKRIPEDYSWENESGFWIFRPIMSGKAVAILAEPEESYSNLEIQCPEKVEFPTDYGIFKSGEYDVVAMIISEKYEDVNPWSVILIPDSVEEIHFGRNSHNQTSFKTGSNATYFTRNGDLFSADGKSWLHHHQMAPDEGPWPGTEIPDGVEVLETGVLNYQYSWDFLRMPTSVKRIKNYALAEAIIKTIDFGENAPDVQEMAFNSSRSSKVGKVRINRLWKDIPEGFLERVLQRSSSKFESCICKAPDLQDIKKTVPGKIDVTAVDTDAMISILLSDIDAENISECPIETYDGQITGTYIKWIQNGNHKEEAFRVYESPSVVMERMIRAGL